MKIAFLAHTSSSLYLFRLPVMLEMKRLGHEVYAICPNDDKNGVLKKAGFEIISYNISRKSLNPLKELRTIISIYGAIKGLKLDILHTFTAKPNIYGTLAGFAAKVPVILNLVEGLGSFYVRDNFKNSLVRFVIESLYRAIFRLSNACVFVNSDDPKYLIGKKIIDPKKAVIIKSVGIDTREFDMAKFPRQMLDGIRKQEGLEGEIIVLMVARAIWDKGVGEFYGAAEKLHDKYPNARFVFVGDTDKGNHTCVERAFLQNPCVRWLGHRDDDIADLTAISDIYVLPSYREGVPRVLLEAASMSKPIVTTDTVGCREVVDNCKNGFLVPVKDVEVLAEAIEILIKDKRLRAKMGANSREKALMEFDLPKITEQYIKLYDKFYGKEK